MPKRVAVLAQRASVERRNGGLGDLQPGERSAAALKTLQYLVKPLRKPDAQTVFAHRLQQAFFIRSALADGVPTILDVFRRPLFENLFSRVRNVNRARVENGLQLVHLIVPPRDVDCFALHDASGRVRPGDAREPVASYEPKVGLPRIQMRFQRVPGVRERHRLVRAEGFEQVDAVRFQSVIRKNVANHVGFGMRKQFAERGATGGRVAQDGFKDAMKAVVGFD